MQLTQEFVDRVSSPADTQVHIYRDRGLMLKVWRSGRKTYNAKVRYKEFTIGDAAKISLTEARRRLDLRRESEGMRVRRWAAQAPTQAPEAPAAEPDNQVPDLYTALATIKDALATTFPNLDSILTAAAPLLRTVASVYGADDSVVTDSLSKLTGHITDMESKLTDYLATKASNASEGEKLTEATAEAPHAGGTGFITHVTIGYVTPTLRPHPPRGPGRVRPVAFKQHPLKGYNWGRMYGYMQLRDPSSSAVIMECCVGRSSTRRSFRDRFHDLGWNFSMDRFEAIKPYIGTKVPVTILTVDGDARLMGTGVGLEINCPLSALAD